MEARATDAKEVKDDVVAPWIKIGAENVQPGCGKGSGNLREEIGAIPGADPHLAVSTFRSTLPADGGRKRSFRFGRPLQFDEKLVHQAEMIGDRRRAERLEITLRHVLKLGVDLVAESRAERAAQFVLRLLALAVAQPRKILTFLEVPGGRAVEFPDQRFLPVAPVFVARPLAVRERQQHQRIEPRPGFHDLRELDHGGRIVDVPSLGRAGKCEVVIDQENQRAAPLRREDHPRGHLLREQRARLRVVPRARGLPGVVQEDGEVQDRGVLELLEQLPVFRHLRVVAREQGVEFLNAHQRVLVGRITVKKLVLDKAEQRAELGEVAAQHAGVVHPAQDAGDPAALSEDVEKNLPGVAQILIRSVDQAELAPDELEKFRAEILVPILRVLKEAQQPARILVKHPWGSAMQKPAAPDETVNLLPALVVRRSIRRPAGMEGGSPQAFEKLARAQVQVPRMPVIILHECLVPPERVGLGIAKRLRDL